MRLIVCRFVSAASGGRVGRSEKEEKSGSRRGASLCEPRELLKFEPGSGDSDDVGRLGPLLSLRDFKLDQPPLPNRGRQIRAWVRYFGGENSRQELPNAGECTKRAKAVNSEWREHFTPLSGPPPCRTPFSSP